MAGFCTQCGKPLKDGGKFCPSCGTPLSDRVDGFAPSVQPSSQQRKHGRRTWPVVLGVTLAGIVLMGVAFRLWDPFDLWPSHDLDADIQVRHEAAFVPGQSANLGNVQSDGWEVVIPSDAFPKAASLSMEIRPERAGEFLRDDAELLGSVMELEASEESLPMVYLDAPASVTVQLPDTGVEPGSEHRLMAAIRVDGQWFYRYPSKVDWAQRLLTFETDHFTPFAVVSLKDQAAIDRMAADLARREWEMGNAKAQILSRMDTQIKDVLLSYGITDSVAQDRAMLNIRLNPKFDAFVRGVEAGKSADMEKLSGELISDAAMTLFMRFTPDVVTGMKSGKDYAKGAVEFERGNYGKALEQAVKGTVRLFPIAGNLLVSATEGLETVEVLQHDYDRFSRSVGYYAYVNQIMGDGGTYDIQSYEWEQMLRNMYGSVAKAKEAFLREEAKVTGQSVEALRADPAKVDEIYRTRCDDLNRSFLERYRLDKDLEERNAAYARITKGFIREGFFARGSLGFDVGMTLEERMNALFAARSYVLDLFDGEMPVLNLGETAEDNLNQALITYVLCRGDTAQFYAWLQEKGYLGQAAEPTPTPEPEEEKEEETSASAAPTVSAEQEEVIPATSEPSMEASAPLQAWVFLGTVTNDWEAELELANQTHLDNWKHEASYSEGSTSYRQTFIGKESGDSWLKTGYSQAVAFTWTSPPQDVVFVDKEFSMSVSATHLGHDHPNQSGIGALTVQMYYVDDKGNQLDSGKYLTTREGVYWFSSDYKNEYAPMSGTVNGTFGRGAEGDRLAVVVTTSGGSKVVVKYLYVWSSMR